MPALPAALQPLLEQALLRTFGDLEAVVADALKKALLALPLFAVELLLCSDKLKVGLQACSVLATLRQSPSEKSATCPRSQSATPNKRVS